jgi:hypothetical protein
VKFAVAGLELAIIDQIRNTGPKEKYFQTSKKSMANIYAWVV